MKLTTFSTVKDGRVSKQAAKYIRDLIENSEGDYLEINIKSIKNKRSLRLNKFYWAVVIDLAYEGLKAIGHYMSPDAVHDFLKGNSAVMTRKVVNNDGQVKTGTRSTSELSNTEFLEYVEEIRDFAIEYLGVDIPEPDSSLRK